MRSTHIRLIHISWKNDDTVLGCIMTPHFNEKSDVNFSATFHLEEDPLIAGV